jgi:hypothetical protein
LAACKNKHYDICFWAASVFKITKDDFSENNSLVELMETICSKGDLQLLIWFTKICDVKLEDIKNSVNDLLNFCLISKNIPLCKWFYEFFNLKNFIGIQIYFGTYQSLSLTSSYDILQWLVTTFNIEKSELLSELSNTLNMYCRSNEFEKISELCNFIGLSQEELSNLTSNIRYLSDSQKEEILDRYIPFGSFTKPTKY